MVWLRRIRSLFGRDALKREYDEEMRFHLAMREERNRDEGMGTAEARRRARLRFGNPAVWRERLSEVDLLLFPLSVWQDLRFGARMLARNWSFTAVAVFALALGIGINTAAFTAYRTFVARKIDARDPDRIVNLALILQDGGTSSLFSYPEYIAYRDGLHSTSGVIATGLPQFLTLKTAGGVALAENQGDGSLIGKLGWLPTTGTSESADAMVVSENFFSVLGVSATRGRVFEPGDEAALLRAPAVLISENYWQKRFRGDPAIIGKSVRLNGAAFTIMGVTPHNFVGTFVEAPDFWLPLSLEPLVHPTDNWLTNREDTVLHLRARLAPGVTMRGAENEMSVVADHLRALHESHSKFAQPVHALVWPGSPFTIPLSQNRSLILSILFVMGAVLAVLVVACANVASLQLARASARQNELAMRLSLGASRGRLIRQLLTESGLLAVLAGIGAFLVSWAVLEELVVQIANAFPEEYGTFIFRATPDLSIFMFVLAVSLLAGVLFGVAPAFESSHSAVAASLKANAGASPLRRHRVRGVLMAAQVALSAVLLIAGGLLIHSAVRALAMSTGYDDAHILDLAPEFPENAAYTPARKTLLSHELAARLATLPGVAAVTTARAPDDSNFRGALVSINGRDPSERNAKGWLYYTWIQPNYFDTMRIPLLAGRAIGDGSGAAHFVVLSQSAAHQLWPGQNPIGRTLRLGTQGQFTVAGEPVPDGPVWRVIGVARDTRGVLFDNSDAAQIYLPMPDDAIAHYPILIRTNGDPMHLSSALGAVLAATDPDITVRALTLEQMLRSTPAFIGSTLAAAIASVTGLLGLVLVSVGIYGTVSFIVVQRTREVGIRMALGATRGSVLALILRESARPVLAGLSVGLVLAAGVGYLLRHILYGVPVLDPLSFGVVSLVLLGVAMAAAAVPSRHAMRVDPMVALRYE